MRYWDSSALVSLLVDEAPSRARRAILREDPMVLTWWLSAAECASALNRLHRDRAISVADLDQALRRLRRLSAAWAEVQPGDRVRSRALRLLRLHPLRAGDALQLAASLAACEEEPASLAFVCSDDRLAAAARNEGFSVV